MPSPFSSFSFIIFSLTEQFLIMRQSHPCWYAPMLDWGFHAMCIISTKQTKKKKTNIGQLNLIPCLRRSPLESHFIHWKKQKPEPGSSMDLWESNTTCICWNVLLTLNIMPRSIREHNAEEYHYAHENVFLLETLMMGWLIATIYRQSDASEQTAKSLILHMGFFLLHPMHSGNVALMRSY